MSEDARPKRPWKRWALEIGVVLAIFFAFRAWQTWDAPSGPAPALRGHLLDGAPYALAAEGAPVLVHFWATWCGVCQAEEDNIVAVARDHRVITVATRSGQTAQVAGYMRERGLDFSVLEDPTGAIARGWGVRAFPTSFVLDGEGNIRHVEVGYTSTLGLRARLWLAGF
ncbi:MAG: redoxin family protein [Sandaracinaceae bacterium]|nr:redoxin family protein [Sandaracinaceae bacterium]